MKENKSRLYEEFSRCILQTVGTDIEPQHMVKYGGEVMNDWPLFNAYQDDYEFASGVSDGVVMWGVAPVEISLSDEALCAAALDCFNYSPHALPNNKKKWINDRELFMLDGVAYTPVITANMRLYWMNCLTGSLFKNSGECMSGNNNIKLDNLCKAQRACAELLMTKKAIR